MVSGGLDTTPIAPTVIIVPTSNDPNLNLSGSNGMLVMSGAKLYVCNGTTWELVTSA